MKHDLKFLYSVVRAVFNPGTKICIVQPNKDDKYIYKFKNGSSIEFAFSDNPKFYRGHRAKADVVDYEYMDNENVLHLADNLEPFKQ